MPRKVRPSWVVLCAAMPLAACSSSSAKGGGPTFAKDSGFDYALDFDGIDDYATMGTARFPVANMPQTVSLWIEPRAASGRQALVTMRRDFDSGVELGLEGTVPTAWRVYGSDSPIAAADALEPDTWHHLAYVYTGTEHQLFVDGALEATSTLEPNKRTPTLGWLGSLDGSSQMYSGRLDEVKIWNSALSADALAAEATGTEPFDDGTLVGYWTFDESGGSRAYDRSPSGNDVALGDGIEAWQPKRVLSDAPHARLTR